MEIRVPLGLTLQIKGWWPTTLLMAMPRMKVVMGMMERLKVLHWPRIVMESKAKHTGLTETEIS